LASQPRRPRYPGRCRSERRFRFLCALSLVSFVIGPFAAAASLDTAWTDQLSRRRNENKPSRIACPAADDYQDAMTLLDLANPTKFLSLTARILPWLAGATAILLLIGLYQSAMAPDDYQQGATVKIMSSTCRMRGCRCSSGA